MCKYMKIYIFKHMYIYIYIHTCMYIYICIYIYVYIYIHECIYVYIHVYIYIYMYICIYKYTCIYVYIHIYRALLIVESCSHRTRFHLLRHLHHALCMVWRWRRSVMRKKRCANRPSVPSTLGVAKLLVDCGRKAGKEWFTRIFSENDIFWKRQQRNTNYFISLSSLYANHR